MNYQPPSMGVSFLNSAGGEFPSMQAQREPPRTPPLSMHAPYPNSAGVGLSAMSAQPETPQAPPPKAHATITNPSDPDWERVFQLLSATIILIQHNQKDLLVSSITSNLNQLAAYARQNHQTQLADKLLSPKIQISEAPPKDREMKMFQDEVSGVVREVGTCMLSSREEAVRGVIILKWGDDARDAADKHVKKCTKLLEEGVKGRTGKVEQLKKVVNTVPKYRMVPHK